MNEVGVGDVDRVDDRPAVEVAVGPVDPRLRVKLALRIKFAVNI